MIFRSKVVIEARNGSQYAGDIAIDDIDLKDGSCPSAVSCGFEAPGICHYRVTPSPVSRMKWTRSRDGTASLFTGPKYDHTYGTQYGTNCK